MNNQEENISPNSPLSNLVLVRFISISDVQNGENSKSIYINGDEELGCIIVFSLSYRIDTIDSGNSSLNSSCESPSVRVCCFCIICRLNVHHQKVFILVINTFYLQVFQRICVGVCENLRMLPFCKESQVERIQFNIKFYVLQYF